MRVQYQGSAPARRAKPGRKRGEQHHRARYADATVRAVVRAHEAGEGGYIVLGRRFGVPSRTVADWVQRATRFSALR